MINFENERDILNEMNVTSMKRFLKIYIYLCYRIIFYVSKTVVANNFEIKFSTEQ